VIRCCAGCAWQQISFSFMLVGLNEAISLTGSVIERDMVNRHFSNTN